MSRVSLLGVVLILALIMGACAPAPAATEIPREIPTVSVPVIANTATPEAAITEAPTEAATSAAPAGSQTAESTEAPIGTDSTVRIATSSSPSVSAPFLVDQTGRTLYLFMTDSQNSGTSACTGTCLAEWPAVVVTGVPSAGMGINAALLGTITRDDGTMQATYNGWPLHYYAGDVAAGSIAGQGMENSWFMVSATGNAIQN